MNKDFTKFSNNELLKFIIKKDKRANLAFSEFYDRHQKDVRTYCKYLLESNSFLEDIFQETFFDFYKNIVNNNEVPENAVGYLLRIARYKCLKYNRDKKVNVSFDDISFDKESNDGLKYEDEELLELIKKSLVLIDEQYREVFILKEFNGYTHEKIAEIIGITVANSKIRLFRANKELNKILEPYIKDIKKNYE